MGAKFQDKGERDLFDQFQTADNKIRKKTRSLLPHIKKSLTLSYENMLFLAIGFIMSCIISFSLGVEKGRQDINHPGQQKETTKIEVDGEKKKDAILAREMKVEDEYIIQIASFKNLSSAEEELARLKRDGYAPNIKKSGDYYQLFISGFNTKQKAHNLFSELQKKYKDCYIRKL